MYHSTKSNIRIHPNTILLVEFEESDQIDFAFLQLDAKGKIIKSWPFKSPLVDAANLDLKTLKIGQKPMIKMPDGEIREIECKVEGVDVV